ncbi:hypothetical protein Pfo_026672 [Paulownia fortunei]|nr:hypothetical protein Pfo_026672 [Paulownia fortunei]
MFKHVGCVDQVKQIGRAYNQELKWIMERQMPSFEDFMTNSVITSATYLIFTALVPGMKSVTKETIDWLLSAPKIVISAAKMARHLQDLGSHEVSTIIQYLFYFIGLNIIRGKMVTVVDCYMKQHGLSKQETLSKFAELAEDGWKDVNTEWVTKISVPREMVEQLLNYARMAEFLYKNCEDGFTDPEKNLAPQVVALSVDPILI